MCWWESCRFHKPKGLQKSGHLVEYVVAEHYSRSHDVVDVYDVAGDMIEADKHLGEFKE
jgi:hypothetical protein